ncbi:MAG TPA: hypothetical protein VFX10_08315 [Nitrospira sp.]|nr:hypothetical protein [Nitrospira sp.]
MAAIAKTAKDGQAATKGVEGHLVTRPAMDVGALVRLVRLHHSRVRKTDMARARTDKRDNWRRLLELKESLCLTREIPARA